MIKALSKLKLIRKNINDFVVAKNLCFFKPMGATIKILYIGNRDTIRLKLKSRQCLKIYHPTRG